jgi:hypothetical protein
MAASLFAPTTKLHVPASRTQHTHLDDAVTVRVVSAQGKAYLLTVGDLRRATYLKFPDGGSAINLAATKLTCEDVSHNVRRELVYMPSDRVPVVPVDARVVTARHRIE